MVSPNGLRRVWFNDFAADLVCTTTLNQTENQNNVIDALPQAFVLLNFSHQVKLELHETL
jgi:hypothetical protein